MATWLRERRIKYLLLGTLTAAAATMWLTGAGYALREGGETSVLCCAAPCEPGADAAQDRTDVLWQFPCDDSVPPVLRLRGQSSLTISAGSAYEEPGWTAEDDVDGDLTDSVQVTGSVDIYRSGDYSLTYTVADAHGNCSTAQRTVTVLPVPQADTVEPEGKIIYLTFDDGPGPYTPQLLETLETYNVKATFFTVNTRYVSLIADEAAAGHSVGIHSASHDYARIYQSEEAYFADLYQMQDIIEETAGIRPTLLRFPGGSSNTVSKRYCKGIMTDLSQAVLDRGFQYFDWNVLSGDAGETTSTDDVAQNVIDGVQRQEISIVLQHDTRGFSVNAVEKIIVWGLAHGYAFLPLEPSSPTVHQCISN